MHRDHSVCLSIKVTLGSGQNLAGYAVLRLPKCGKGTVVKLRYAEATAAGSGGARLRNQFESCDSRGLQGPATIQGLCALQEVSGPRIESGGVGLSVRQH